MEGVDKSYVQHLHSLVALMVANTTPCAPFYEPGAPPPPIPLLTAQTDLLDNAFRPTTLVNTETLPRGLARASPARTNQITHQRHVQIPSNTRIRARAASPSPSQSALDSDASDLSDSSELSGSDSSDESDDGTIPKPLGEAGRPGRGGYTLEIALEWNPKAFKKLRVRQLQNYTTSSDGVSQTYVHDLTEDHLDTTKCYSGQSLQSLRVVCNAVRETCYPILYLHVHGCTGCRQVSRC
jgi:hypothetical protein